MKKFSFLIVISLLIVGGLGAWWINGTMPANPTDETLRSFTISKGEGVRQVANNLKAEGFIKDPVIFFLLMKKQEVDSNIQAGEFQLAPAMNANEILNKLQTATNDITITIPEGKRAEEIADILEKNFAAYNPSWEPELVAHEGYLFPDTYSFPVDADIADIVTTMTENFDKKYASIPSSTRGLSENEVVLIASMVEREAKYAEDRPLVASVILNRLELGMSLDIDATVQYAVGDENNWWPPLGDYARNIMPESLYNTYTNVGLPPAPISNPGLDVLSAVANAPDTNYIFYITDPATGKNVYSTTLEEHNANIEKYGI